MKIVHLNTLDSGGAAVAAHRIHAGLLEAGIDSRMLVLNRTRSVPGVETLPSSSGGPSALQALFQHWNGIARRYPARPPGLELFSDTRTETSLSGLAAIEAADIVHLHWVAGIVNPCELPAVAHGKRFVWTLHDMNPFTGGCHYAGQCGRYHQQCGACPQLGSEDDDDLTRRIWRQKADGYAALDPAIVAPSRWLAGCARQSGLMGRFDIRVIPYGLPLATFKPRREAAGIRARWNIPETARIVLFGADAAANPRKGLHFLIEAIKRIAADRPDRGGIHLLVFGNAPSLNGRAWPFPSITTGRIADPQLLSEIYSAADVYVIPSTEDNLPNTAIEALACGTPVVGFRTGGIPDIVVHQHTGYLAEAGNAMQLADGIGWVLNALGSGINFGERCRSAAQSRFASEIQARAYIDLYEGMRARRVYPVARVEAPGITTAASAWPKISIVTPSFNQARFLETCIRSVLDQDYPNLEYIIMDGGSTDGSGTVIERYADRLAHWQSQPDQGHYWAIQEGLRRSSGEIVTWLNSDDQLCPGILKRVASIFRERPDVDWITGRPCLTNADGSETTVMAQLPLWSRQRYLDKRYRDPYIQQEGTFWRRALWEKAGARMDCDLMLAGDLALWTRFFRHARLYSVDEPLGIYRVQVNNRSRVHLDRYIDEAEQFLDAEIAQVAREKDPWLPPAPRPITRQEIDGYCSEEQSSCRTRTDQESGPRPLVSAIVSTYNAEPFIRGCLEDLLSQTIADRLEIIVIDSASPQNEAGIVHEFQQRHPNLRYLRTDRRETVYAAWNRGIKLAQGKYITNSNTDDRHRRDALEQMAAVLENEPGVALVYADVIKTATANETFQACTPTGMLAWPDWDRRLLLEKGCFMGPQPMWRRQVHDDFGWFDETLTVAGDYEFWLRISQVHDFKRIARPLGLYLEREDSIEHANRKRKHREERSIVARYRAAAQKGELLGFRNHGDATAGSTVPDAPEGVLMLEQTIPAVTAAPLQGDRPMMLADHVYAAVRMLLGKGQRESARWILEKLLIDFPDHPAALHENAVLAHEDGDTVAAGRCFRKAAELSAANADYQKSLGDFLYVVQKDGEAAIAQYRKTLTLRPRDLDTCLTLAHLNVARKCFEEAREGYQKVLELDPRHPEARACLDKLNTLKQRRHSPEALHDQAREASGRGDRQTAIRLLSQIIAQDPDNAVAHNDLGVLYFETGRKDLAQFHYEKAAERSPENALFQKNLGDFYYVEQGRIEPALRKYVQALTLDPQDIETLLTTGHICLGLNKYEDARIFLDRVLEIEPWNDTALRLLEQLNQGGPEPAVETNDLYGQAQSLAASGDLRGAAERLQRLIADNPDHAMAYNDLGVISYELGDKQRAVQFYEQAVRLDGHNPNYLKNLADFYYVEQGRTQEALRIYIQLLETNREDVDCLIAAGSICAAVDQVDDARVFFERVLEIDPLNQQAGDVLRQLDIGANAVRPAAAVFEFPRNAVAGRAS